MDILTAGFLALKDYIIKHVITCLIPAFLLAGAMVSFISREVIIRHLGVAASKIRSFFLAAAGSFFLTACSCTVIPVSSGLYHRGSGLGPAFVLLWVAPAANILALVYTGAVLGYDMVGARVISAVAMALVIGIVMDFLFRRSEEKRMEKIEEAEGRVITLKNLILILLILATLLLPNYLIRKGPYYQKAAVWALSTLIMLIYAFRVKPLSEIRSWLRETFWFARMIFPLLLAGVFLVGVIGKLLPQSLIQNWLGGSGLRASFLATLIGAVSYFATMTEAPFVDTLMKLGMGKGPALALLLTGPGISLPNWLAVARFFGIKKALAYILMVIILGTLVGWFFGNFIFN